MAREKDNDFARKGNWKNAPGSKAKTKTGAGAKPKAKPAKAKSASKPRKKPDMAVKKAAAKVKSPAKKSGASRSTSGKTNKVAQNRSGDAGLGQGRKSPAANKMNRQPGYSSDSNKSAKMNKYEKRKQARTGRK